MNLQEILNYRNNCIVCNRKMELSSINFTLKETDDGVLVKSKSKNNHINFHYNGIYKYSEKANLKNIDTKPLYVLKECPHCIGKGKNKRTLIKSSLNNLKSFRCAYAFKIFYDVDGNFTCKLSWEDIKFYHSNEFYHCLTDFDKNESSIKSGNFQSDTIDSIIRINVPIVNTNKFLNKEVLINKIKLYNLFS